MPIGTLILTRPRQYADRLRRYRIIVDGGEVGRLKSGEELRIGLSQGKHRIVARIDWARSNELSVEIRAGEAIEIEVGSNARRWLLIAAIYFTLIGFRQYLYLRHRVTGFPVTLVGGAATVTVDAQVISRRTDQ